MVTISLIHLMATGLMTGLIWIVQLIHYPTFRRIPAEDFPDFEAMHVVRTSLFVLPVMLMELITALWLSYNPPGMQALWWHVNLGLLVVIWASTYGLQLPLHWQLSKEKSNESIKRLVSSNWIRTVLWSVRSVLVLILVSKLIANEPI